jgi:hypothetical protein
MANGVQTSVAKLRDAIKPGEVYDAEAARLDADELRNLILSLPPFDGPLSLFMPLGFAIRNATIAGRLQLANVSMPGGAPVGTIEFIDCTFEGGFSGAGGHFRGLGFHLCQFRDVRRIAGADGHEPPEPGDDSPMPTIDLSGATVETEIDMRKIRPADDGEKGGEAADRAYLEGNPNPDEDVLWVRLAGARIGGKLDLTDARLRAPEDARETLVRDDSIDALNLTLAVVEGDFLFVRGRSRGRIKARDVSIKGDVWMNGAKLNGMNGGALLFQGATIGGVLMLGPDDNPGGETEGLIRDGLRLRTRGQLNFHDLHIGRTIAIGDIEASPSAEQPRAGQSLLCLEGARVGGSVEIVAGHPGSYIAGKIQLGRLEVKDELKLERLQLGAPAETLGGGALIEARSLVAGAMTIDRVTPLPSTNPCDRGLELKHQLLSVDLSNATMRRLTVVKSRFNAFFKAPGLRCADDVRIEARVAGDVDLEGATMGGSLDLSELQITVPEARLSLNEGKIGRALRLTRPGPSDETPPKLKYATRTHLSCLPRTALLETLWEFDWSGTPKHRQVAFLERRGVILLLDRQPDTLASFIKHYGHGLRSTDAVAEYFQLYCAYGETERASRWVIVAAKLQKALENWRLKTGVALSPPAGGSPPGSSGVPVLRPSDFHVNCQALPSGVVGKRYEVAACLLLDDHLIRASCEVDVTGEAVSVSNMRELKAGLTVTGAPASNGQFTDHSIEGRTGLVTPNLLSNCEELKKLDRLEKRLRPYLRSGFSMRGKADLRNLSCGTLEDEGGRLWGRWVEIAMTRFVYAQTTWDADAEAQRRPTGERTRHWLRRFGAECIWPPSLGAHWGWTRSLGWFEWGRRLRDRTDYWAMWQDRRNWLFQQFERSAILPCRSRHMIDEFQYAAQPFDQVIKVARAEGREDYATHFEMLKSRIEWRLFNRRIRWALGPLGILFGSAWLIYKNGPSVPIVSTLILTWIMMASASTLRGFVDWALPNAPAALRKAVTHISFYFPASILFFWGGYYPHPLPFLEALLIYSSLRLVSVFAHAFMRFGFGYLRRPARAIITLLLAFLIGWRAVQIADDHHMLVVAAEPAATIVSDGESPPLPKGALVMGSLYRPGNNGAAGEPPGPGEVAAPAETASPPGSESPAGGRPSTDGEGRPEGERIMRDISCTHEISHPLYALDVLIPIIDLGEDSRCEIRRVEEQRPQPRAGSPEATSVDDLGFGELWRQFPERAFWNNRFWWWMHALYAVAGWFIVSLSILTFAQVNRMHAEPPEQKHH